MGIAFDMSFFFFINLRTKKTRPAILITEAKMIFCADSVSFLTNHKISPTMITNNKAANAISSFKFIHNKILVI